MLYSLVLLLMIGGWIAGSYFVVGVNQKRLNWVMTGLIILWTLGNSITVVPAGHVGVMDLFGLILDTPLEQGPHLVYPILAVHKMSIRMQEIKEKADVPSSEGLNVTLEASAQFNLNPRKAPEVYRTLGPKYVQVFFEPQFRSHTRGATVLFEAKALYTSGREVVGQKIWKDLAPMCEARGIINLQILLRDLKLPEVVASAIEQKLKSEQEAQQMVFVLQKEEQEAKRKKIEAGGISTFQKIVSEGISEKLIKWKAIEATLKISESPNSKVVIIGSGKEGLPVILGGQQ